MSPSSFGIGSAERRKQRGQRSSRRSGAMTRPWCYARRPSSAALTLRASRGLPHSMPSVARPPRLNPCSTRAVWRFRGVSPFPLAQLEFQRGHMWREAGHHLSRAHRLVRWPPGDACRPMRRPRAIWPRWRLSYWRTRGRHRPAPPARAATSDDPDYARAVGPHTG